MTTSDRPGRPSSAASRAHGWRTPSRRARRGSRPAGASRAATVPADRPVRRGRLVAGQRRRSALDLRPGRGPVGVRGRTHVVRPSRQASVAWPRSRPWRSRPRPPRGRSSQWSGLARQRARLGVGGRLAEVLGHRGIRLGRDDVVHEHVDAVGMLGLGTRASRCRTSRSSPPWAGRPRPWPPFVLEHVGDDLPGGAEDAVTRLERGVLVGVQAPVPADDAALRLSRSTAAWNWVSSSAYGLVMPSSGWVAMRYTAASAM